VNRKISLFLLCVVPSDAPSDVAVYNDYNNDAVRVIWSLPVLLFSFCTATRHLIVVLLLNLVLIVSYLLVLCKNLLTITLFILQPWSLLSQLVRGHSRKCSKVLECPFSDFFRIDVVLET